MRVFIVKDTHKIMVELLVKVSHDFFSVNFHFKHNQYAMCHGVTQLITC